MAKRLTPAIEEKIKLFSQQRSELISKRGEILDSKNVIPEYKTHGKNIGRFVLEQICKLGLQPEIKTKSKKNVTKAHPNDTDHVERSEKAVQTDSDIIASDRRSDADLAIESPVKTVSPIVVEIGNVENFSVKDRPSSLFRMRLHGTELEINKATIFQTVAMQTVIQTLIVGTGMAGVRGDACSGKTSVLYGAMQIFGDKNKDWKIILITNEEHLRACYDEHNVLIAIDDILDHNGFILQHLDTIKNYIDTGHWKVIYSFSNESYTTIKQNALKYIDGGHVLNISLSYECTDNEKMGILNTNCIHVGYTLPEETCKQCVESVPTKYFFYYVRRYFNTEEHMGECVPIDLFQNPIEEIERDLNSLKTSNLLGFYILFCCSILDRDLDISIQHQTKFNEHAQAISKWLLASKRREKSLKKMQFAGKQIPKEFVEHTGIHKYRIKFNCIVRGVHFAILKELNVTSLSDSGKLFKHALFLCDYSIIRTCLRGDNNAGSTLQLKVHEYNFRYVAERFIEEIQSGHVQRVGQHPLFSNDEFKRTFDDELRSKHDENYIWDIFSKLDKQTDNALIVFAVEHDKPDHTTNLTNIILKSKKWRKYSRKEGNNVQRQHLVLSQNASALKRAVRYTIYKSTHTLTALIDSVFGNVSRICKWKFHWKEEALRIITEVHVKTVSECPETTKDVMELFQNIEIGSYLGDSKQSLLHLCVISGNDYVLEEALTYRKVEINRRDVLGQTPLHTAVEENNLEAVRILIKYGAVIEIRDRNGNTAIHLAIHKSIHILEELICANGTDVNVRNNDGKTPYQLARDLNKKEHMKTLEKADVNDQ